MTHKDSANYSKGKLAVGYGVIVLLIGAIISLYISEWRQLEKLEQEVKHINVLRQKVHDAYAKKLELAMHGETILEWEATDTIRYRTKRLQLDSLLCEFKQDYPPHRLDSLRRLLEDKENQLFNIWTLLQVQDTLNEQLASQVPIIAYNRNTASRSAIEPLTEAERREYIKNHRPSTFIKGTWRDAMKNGKSNIVVPLR